MKILITGRTMTYLSGQPLYVYELARELSKTNDVSVLSDWTNNELHSNLVSAGVKCITEPENEYDLIIASEFKPDVKGFTINIVHSEYDCETPIPNCDMYVCIRPSIQKHIIEQHNIPKEKTKVIYNGVDRDRFTDKYDKTHKQSKNFKLTVVPCTIDKLREKFLNHLISIAGKDNMYMMVGDDFGANLKPSPFVIRAKSTFNIEKYIQQADEVAGILLGRVNLEARSCGIPSLIYDPETLKVTKYFPKEELFDKRHNIKNVAKQIIKLYEK
jgi:hypothetical protein